MRGAHVAYMYVYVCEESAMYGSAWAPRVNEFKRNFHTCRRARLDEAARLLTRMFSFPRYIMCISWRSAERFSKASACTWESGEAYSV